MSISSPRRVLVADDDALLRRMLSDILEEEFAVATVADGAAALDLLGRESFVAVISDYMMPEVTGLELLRQCQTLQPNAVRILVTASDRVVDLRDAVNVARVHRFLVKPFRAVEVLGVIKGAVREVELERENAALVEELQRMIEQVRLRERELEHELEVRNQELKDILDRMREKGVV